jgi:hypothetical protein
MSFCASVSACFVSGGGITSSGFREKTRRMSSLWAGLPETMGISPDLRGLTASSRRSSRSFALRALSSGPWHWKQLRERMGRTSRWKSTDLDAPQAGRASRNHPARRSGHRKSFARD